MYTSLRIYPNYMRSFFTIFFLILFILPLTSYSQKVKIKKPIREIWYVNLYEEANKPFFRRNQELVRLVFDGINSEKITPLDIDFTGEKEIQALSIEQWIDKISFKNSLPEYPEFLGLFGDQLLFPTEFKYVGMDITYDQEANSLCQVNYLHFFPAEKISETQEPQYRFSVSWNQLIEYLSEYQDLLYYTNSWGILWRGEAMITSTYYAVDEKAGQALIDLSINTGALPAQDTSGFPVVLSNKATNSLATPDIYFKENKENSWYSTEKIGVIQYDDSFPFSETQRFEFEWSDFLKIAQDSGWLEKTPVLKMSEALKRNLFSYSSLPALPVSKNGRFINGNKDPLCNKRIKASFANSPASELVAYSVEHWDLISTLEPKNKPLIKLPELIYEYVLSGKLTPYFTDSLNRVMNMKELKASAARCFTAPEFTRESSYRKGDIVAVDTDNFFYSYFIALQNIGQEGKLPTHSRSWKAYQPPLFPSSELYLIDLKSNLSYNQDGQKKRYQLQGLGLYIPHDSQINERGIMLPICYVKWEELKNLLVMDERNKLNLKGAETSMTELLENRGFFSIFLKTSNLKP